MEQNFAQLTHTDIQTVSLSELRDYWAQAWKRQPHRHISRKILVRSLLYKINEAKGGGLSYDQHMKLDQLVRAYKRGRIVGAQRRLQIKPGTQIIREWNGIHHTVVVKSGLFEYNGREYRSLSAIASEITGTRWNGWTFFGIKKPANSVVAA
jgi:hypothetical protein